MTYGVNFYRGTQWVGAKLYLDTEQDAREHIESWIAENPREHGYELVEASYIVERSIKRSPMS